MLVLIEFESLAESLVLVEIDSLIDALIESLILALSLLLMLVLIEFESL